MASVLATVPAAVDSVGVPSPDRDGTPLHVGRGRGVRGHRPGRRHRGGDVVLAAERGAAAEQEEGSRGQAERQPGASAQPRRACAKCLIQNHPPLLVTGGASDLGCYTRSSAPAASSNRGFVLWFTAGEATLDPALKPPETPVTPL